MRQVVAYLLDANVVSEMMRPIPEPRVAAFLDRIDEGGIGLASITIWEILDGVGRFEQGKRRDDLAERFLAVVTRNTRDFRNTGAAVVDPWTGVRR